MDHLAGLVGRLVRPVLRYSQDAGLRHVPRRSDEDRGHQRAQRKARMHWTAQSQRRWKCRESFRPLAKTRNRQP